MAITEPDSAPVAPGQMPASSFDIRAPYAAGAPQQILTGGDANPAGRDDVAGSVAAAMAAAEARFTGHEADTHAQGSQIGDLMTFPAATATGAALDPGAAAG